MNQVKSSTVDLEGLTENGTRKFVKALFNLFLCFCDCELINNAYTCRRSLFVHFYPADWKRSLYDNLEVHYRIPPNWDKVLPPKAGLERLVMAETSALEPECEDTWCTLNQTLKWNIRGEFGKAISGDGIKHDLAFEAKNIRTPRHWKHDEL